jgi:hypothetical protein
MKHDILKRLKKTDHLPMLFIGSGMSIRYLGLENWPGLLRRFARLVMDSEYAYEIYEQQAKGLECKEGLLPKIAELIEHDFNLHWFKDEQFRESREQSADEINRSVSPFKIEIARYMREKSQEHATQYAAEIELFKQLEMRSISGVLTTNYDTFIEDLFPSYTKYIGQEELLFSTLHGISEIYKIHGCCTKPESIVINEVDYADFSEKNAYLAAKILTIFLEHPIVFIGYSINDTNIENILKSIIKCLSAENLDKIKERLMFVVRAKEGEAEEVSAYSKSFEGGKSIEMTRIRLKSYEPLYQALLENQAKYNAPMLRRLKQDIYELVLTSKPTGRIRTVNLEDEKLEDVEVVIGVGIPSDFGHKGYAGITAEDIYADVVCDDREYEIDRIVTTTLPSLLPNNSILPMHKYISQYAGELPINSDKIIKDFDGFIASSIKKNRERSNYRNETISSLRRELSLEKCLYALQYLKEENIAPAELLNLIKGVLEANPSALSITEKDKQNLKSDIKRAIRIYDWLRYYKNKGALATAATNCPPC